jgi:hypothetical protein
LINIIDLDILFKGLNIIYFQPFNENENLSMYYREHINLEHTNMISVENSINQYFGNVNITETEEEVIQRKS